MNVFYNTEPMLYEPAARRRWFWSDIVRAVIFVAVVAALACGVFE